MNRISILIILKKLSVFILLASVSVAVLAQKPKVKNDPAYDSRPVHFGFTLGLNTMDYSIRPSQFASRQPSDSLIADLTKIQPGFHVQMVSSFKLANYLTFRFLPGLSFGERQIKFRDLQGESELNRTMSIESSYIEFPCLLKYKAKRVNNYAPYIIGGVNFRYDISAKNEFAEDGEVYVRMNAFDIAYEAGIGIDFYLPYFKFSTEIKLSAGILNVLSGAQHEEFPMYTNSIDKINSSIFMLSFHFE